MAIFFTSDTHFGSSRTLKYSRRPFKSVSEMDEYMISQWNATVGVDDTVYHLGDFGDGAVVQDLSGYIILIYGNYELANDSSILRYGAYFSSLERKAVTVDIGDFMVFCTHRPSQMSRSYFNLFGHVHQLSMVKKHVCPNGQIKRGLNVGVDIFWKPIPTDVVLFYQNAIDNKYDDEVFY